MNWLLIPSAATAGRNDHMPLDARLWDWLPSSDWAGALRFFRFRRPTLTVGRLQRPERWPDLWSELDLEIQARPTGGRAVLHGPGADLCYTVCCPTRHPCFGRGPVNSARAIQEPVRRALRALGLPVEFTGERVLTGPSACCFQLRTECELAIAGRKVAGGAQGRRPGWLLHQGVLLLHWDQAAWLRPFPDLAAVAPPPMVGLAEHAPWLTLDRLEAELTDGFAAAGLDLRRSPPAESKLAGEPAPGCAALVP